MIIRWLYIGYTVVFLNMQGIRRITSVAGKGAGYGALIIYQMSNHINHSEYDAIGELFRRRLENHRMPVDNNGWDEIERRMGKRKKSKAAIWLWSAGAMAAAAAIAALVIFNDPAIDETSVMTVSQQVIPEEPATANLEVASSAALPNTGKVNNAEATTSKTSLRVRQRQSPKGDFRKAPEDNSSPLGVGGELRKGSPKATNIIVSDTTNQDALLVATVENNQEQPGDDEPVVAQTEKEVPKLDVSLVEDRPDEENEADTKEKKKWLLAAALGTGGYTDGFSDSFEEPMAMDASPVWNGLGSGNKYATDLSSNIRSFNEMDREDFKNINHRPPLSFGVTARKSLGKHGGIESGLVYTYLSSEFEWRSYDVHQSLHYIGIPVNMVVYLWQTKPNWRIYLSGGFMIEKGLWGVYKQVGRNNSEIRTTIVKSSSIDGLQWSLNGGLGINYRFNKGLGIYFEPRVGYAFDCDQPISMRTEWPIFIGINMGLNYEF